MTLSHGAGERSAFVGDDLRKAGERPRGTASGPTDPHPLGAPRVVRSRAVLHFPGFEPLSARQHYERYRRSSDASAEAWGMRLTIHELRPSAAGSHFDVEGMTAGVATTSRISIHDHRSIIQALAARPAWRRLASGLGSAATIAWRGGLYGYFAHAWRFGLFFLFPFAVLGGLAGAVILTLVLAARSAEVLPVVLAAAAIAVSMPIGRMALKRLHVPLLLSNWEFALMLAGSPDRACELWLEALAASVRRTFNGDFDEFVITSHSMGANVAVHVLGMLLEREPKLFDGKTVTFVTLGGATLQCAAIRSARSLRARVGIIARQPGLEWIDVQCLTDPLGFYRSEVVAAAGHPDAPQARVVFVKIRKMVSRERYRRMRGNFLRMHRQYVLGSDVRHRFDFTYLTAGPEPASEAGRWTETPM